jgi:hypothetical protein
MKRLLVSVTFRKLLMHHKIDGRCMETSPGFIQGPLHSSELAYHHSGDMVRTACSYVATCAQHIKRMQGDVFGGAVRTFTLNAVAISSAAVFSLDSLRDIRSTFNPA